MPIYQDLSSGSGQNTIQIANATGVTTIGAWSSDIVIPTLTGNITLIYPTPVGNFGKSITLIMIGVPNTFAITHTPAVGTITFQNSASELGVQNSALRVEAIDATNIRQVSNIGATAFLAEFGELVIPSIFSTGSTTFVDTGFSFVLPSAGVWNVQQDLTLYNNNAAATSETRLVNSANVQVPNSVTIAGSSGGSSNEILNTVQNSFVTTTGATTFKLQLKASSGTANIYVAANATPKIIWNKISGNSPVTGQSVDYGYFKPTTHTPSASTTVPLSASAGNITLTGNDINLKPNTTYRIVASLGFQGGATLNFAQYLITDSSNVQLPNSNLATGASQPSTNGDAYGNVEATITTGATAQVIRVRYNSAVSAGITFAPLQSYVAVYQLGTSAITTTARVNIICRNKTPQSLPTTAWTALTNWVEIQDLTNSFNNTTGIFTAPRDMTVSFTMSNAVPTTLSTQYAGASVLKNGSQLYNILQQGTAATTYIGCSGVVELLAGQTLQAQSYNGGLTNNDIPSTSNSWFTIIEININF